MSHESEKETRKRRIDTKLKALGWNIDPASADVTTSELKAHAVEEFMTDHGPADYALFVRGRLLGIIEAKKIAIGPQNVLEQAKRYASGVPVGAHHVAGDWNGYRVPFLYSSNGELHWFIDMREDKPKSRQLPSLHSPAALEDLLQRDRQATLQWFVDTRIEDIARLRGYQQKAIQETETALMAGKRSLLLAMATGTGKTYTMAAQMYRLLESRFAKRILFLVDRKALAAQVVRELASFNTPLGKKFNREYEVYSQRFQREDFGDDEPFDDTVLPEAYLTQPDGSQTFVYVCTIQRMAINLFGRQASFAQSPGEVEAEEDAKVLDIPIHAFDVIIADECHRGYIPQDDAVWQDTLRHFDAVKIGLTATPAKHTVTLFGEPVFRYPVQDAIREGWLVDYDAVRIQSKIRIQGAFLDEGERVFYVDTGTGEQRLDHLEDERSYPAGDIERLITAPDSNRKVIEEIAKYARAHQERTGRFPKTLIFAVNDVAHTSHADSLVSICRDVFGEGDAFVQKITGNKNVDRPLQRIREFRNRPEPKIVVTVDMLSTGVDIPALEFIVFLRPVKSRILWEQMLGRGTRRCEDLDPRKTHFTVLDCFDGTLIEYFKGATGFEMDVTRTKPIAIPEIIENIWQNVEQDYNVKRLIRRLRRIDREMSGNARSQFTKFIRDGDVGAFAEELPNRVKSEFNKTLALLRDPSFQTLLENYERAKRSFVVAPDLKDQVASEIIFRVGDKTLRPGDYLYEFATFITRHRSDIEALQVLLEKPKGWCTDALDGLRATLRGADFKEVDLETAHRLVHQKALADIISMVKHAVRQEEPLLTAAERVDQALAKIQEGKVFAPVEF